MTPLEKFRAIPAELVIFILQDAQFSVALEAAKASRKPSVIQKVWERIINIKYGFLPMHLNEVMTLQTRYIEECYLNTFAKISNEDSLDIVKGKLVKADFYLHPLTHDFLEKLYFGVLYLLNTIHCRAYEPPKTVYMRQFYGAIIQRNQCIDLNLKTLFLRTIKHFLKPPTLLTEVEFYASRLHGFIMPLHDYPQINTDKDHT